MAEDFLTNPEYVDYVESGVKYGSGVFLATVNYTKDRAEERETDTRIESLGIGFLAGLFIDGSDELISHLLESEELLNPSDHWKTGISYAATYQALDKIF